MPTERRPGSVSRVLTPAAPPRVLEHVYTDDQYERLLDVINDTGPGRRSPRTTSSRSTS